jgi:hypothetical protein
MANDEIKIALRMNTDELAHTCGKAVSKIIGRDIKTHISVDDGTWCAVFEDEINEEDVDLIAAATGTVAEADVYNPARTGSLDRYFTVKALAAAKALPFVPYDSVADGADGEYGIWLFGDMRQDIVIRVNGGMVTKVSAPLADFRVHVADHDLLRHCDGEDLPSVREFVNEAERTEAGLAIVY